MAPKVKFQKDEIINAAFDVVRTKGIDALTARELANSLGVSTRPIFTWFDTMDELRSAVRTRAKDHYRIYIERGLSEPIPFLGVWHQYLTFARDEPALYRFLFLTQPDSRSDGAIEAMQYSQALARESIMQIYNMDSKTADCYFRDLWLAAFSFATLIVTDNCPYTDEEILSVGTEISLAVCKAYKEIPGLPDGNFDRDAIFRTLVQK